MRLIWSPLDRLLFPQPLYFCGAVIGAVIAGGTAFASSEISKSGANSAANAQNNATATEAQTQANALAQQQNNFNLVQGQEAPYRQLGTQNIGSLQSMLSGGYNMQASPSAQYAMTQGTKGINSNLQARGEEGNAVQQLGQLSSSTAAQDYQNRFSNLLAATNIGSNAVAMTGSGANSLNANTQSGANTTNSLMQSAAGNLSNIATGQANTQSGLLGGAAGLLGGAAGQLSGYLNGANSGSGTGYGTTGGFGYQASNDPSSSSFIGPPASAMGGTD